MLELYSNYSRLMLNICSRIPSVVVRVQVPEQAHLNRHALLGEAEGLNIIILMIIILTIIMFMIIIFSIIA